MRHLGWRLQLQLAIANTHILTQQKEICTINCLIHLKTLYLFPGSDPDIKKQRGHDGGWLSAHPVVGTSNDWYSRAKWQLIPHGGDKYLIQSKRSGRYALVNGTIPSGGEGGWLNAPKVFAADSNYYNLAVWKFVPVRL